MQIAQSKTRDQFPLSTKKIIKKTIMGSFLYVVVLAIIYVTIVMQLDFLSAYIGSTVTGVIFILLLIILLNYLYERWYFTTYFYDLTPDFIQIRKGPITPTEINLPYERIQDVYVDQDILDRIFGLYDVHLSSATISSGMEAHIDGLPKQAADGLRALLLQTIKDKMSRKQ